MHWTKGLATYFLLTKLCYTLINTNRLKIIVTNLRLYFYLLPDLNLASDLTPEK